MSKMHNTTFQDRRAAASAAKIALLEKFKARPANDSPEMLARQAERARIASEREKRAAERAQARHDENECLEQERLAQESAAKEVAIVARRAKEQSDQALVKQMLEYEFAQKNKRDARYAARKARQS